MFRVKVLEFCGIKNVIAKKTHLKILYGFIFTALCVHTLPLLWDSYSIFMMTSSNNVTNGNQQQVESAILKRALANFTETPNMTLHLSTQATNLSSESDIYRLTTLSQNDQRRKDTKTASLFTRPPWLRHKTNYPLTLEGDYVINPTRVCPPNESIDYLIIVNSASTYFWKRQAMRQTFASKRQLGVYRQSIVFLLGLSEDRETMAKIKWESIVYGDIVQGAFRDTYHNLTHKGVMGLRWTAEHCPQAKLILKLDDDVFVNPFLFVKEVVPEFRNKKRQIGCHVLYGKDKIYRGRHKWAVSEDEFKGLKYYPFTRCMGYFVIITSDLIRPMLWAARLNPFFWIDDIYLYGMVPATIGDVDFYNIRGRLAGGSQNFKTCYASMRLKCKYVAVLYHGQRNNILWRMLLDIMPTKMKKTYYPLIT